jgi:cytoskeletal protein RodZ
MPKHDPMAQISRPFQIALAVVVLFAGVWLFALQGRFTSSSNGSSASSAPASSASTSSSASASRSSATAKPVAHAHAGGASSHIYHGSAPGLEGLTRDVSRAHEAVAKIGASPQTAAKPDTKTSTTVPSRAVRRTSTAKRAAAGAVTLTGQHTVEAELKHGDVVLLLFWNPNGTDDVVVHRALQQVQHTARSPRQPIAVQEASASQVASYGSVTRGVQVNATPTLFVINKKGQALVLSGVQDAFSIEQAISEARSS